jgi:hypothetical protein
MLAQLLQAGQLGDEVGVQYGSGRPFSTDVGRVLI